MQRLRENVLYIKGIDVCIFKGLPSLERETSHSLLGCLGESLSFVIQAGYSGRFVEATAAFSDWNLM